MTGPVLPDRVRIIEVGPRDGLQNETVSIPTERKLDFIRALAETGLGWIEATSFVHPRAIPQLADAEAVVAGLPAGAGVVFSALVPNRRGLDRALAAGVERIAVFTAASEAFTERNINMTVDESLEVFAPLVAEALEAGVSVRGYVSTAFVCPFSGDIPPARVVEVTQTLLDLGVDEVAVSDTIGAAVPRDIHRTVGALLDANVDKGRLALHLHDTYGTALANVYAGLSLGITTYDASTGGLGGCPFAPGAAGNLATEDLVYFLDRLDVASGVDLDLVVAAADVIAPSLERPLASRQHRLRRRPESA